jgi:hypothetical protein
MKITTYNQHGRLLPPRGLVLKPRLFWPEASLRPYPINICLQLENVGFVATTALCRPSRSTVTKSLGALPLIVIDFLRKDEGELSSNELAADIPSPRTN